MNIRLGRHVHDEGKIIDACGHMRKNAAHPTPALAVLLPIIRALHDVARSTRRRFHFHTQIKLSPLRLISSGL